MSIRIFNNPGTNFNIGATSILALVQNVIENGLGNINLESIMTIYIHPKDLTYLEAFNKSSSYTVEKYLKTVCPKLTIMTDLNAIRLEQIYHKNKEEAKNSMIEFNKKRALYFKEYCQKIAQEIADLI